MASTHITVCSNVDSKCAAYDNSKHTQSSPYTCSGNRSIDITRKHLAFNTADPGVQSDFPSYSAGSIIEAIDLSSIYQTLTIEVQNRKNHIIYNTAKPCALSVAKGDLIDDLQQTSLKSYLIELDKIVNANSKFGDTHLGEKATTFESVSVGKLAEENDATKHDISQFNDTVSHLMSGVGSLVQDCICYSDCVSYYKYLKRVCSCVGNYGCGYY